MSSLSCFPAMFNVKLRWLGRPAWLCVGGVCGWWCSSAVSLLRYDPNAGFGADGFGADGFGGEEEEVEPAMVGDGSSDEEYVIDEGEL
jgi:hypothetical protein